MESGYSLLFRYERWGRNSFLGSCSKRLHKWKSWEASSNSSNKVCISGNAQWQLFDSDYNNCKPMVGIKVRTHMTKDNIDAVPLKINLYAQRLSNTLSNKFAIKIHSQALGGYINAILRDINLHPQWLSQYGRPVAISIHTPSGNIKNSPRNINLYAQCCLNSRSQKV